MAPAFSLMYDKLMKCDTINLQYYCYKEVARDVSFLPFYKRDSGHLAFQLYWNLTSTEARATFPLMLKYYITYFLFYNPFNKFLLKF